MSLLKKAIKITYDAHKVVEEILKPGLKECEVQAEIERVFRKNNCRVAFPSIVASGKNTTVLHYESGDRKLRAGELLVVDIGAEYRYYCADITRTYAVSGSFTDRQHEVVNLVREAQEYVMSWAKPGMFLVNKEDPDKSLHHIALKFFQERGGYDQYFVHGIGHFLGLDVHDVGDLAEPLGRGDVFTVEPGIYIPEENIGVRIEDDLILVN